MGTSDSARIWRHTSAPSMPGIARSKQHGVDPVGTETAQRLFTVVRGHDAMAGLAEERAERADPGRLVVDDEDRQPLSRFVDNRVIQSFHGQIICPLAGSWLRPALHASANVASSMLS